MKLKYYDYQMYMANGQNQITQLMLLQPFVCIMFRS